MPVHSGHPLRVMSCDRDQRHGAGGHLPGGQRERVDGRAALQELDQQRSSGPGESGGDGEHPAQRAADVPGAHDEDEAGERERDGRPLQAAKPLTQEEPGEQQQPERHRVHQHRDLAGAAHAQGKDGEAVEQRRLKEADRHRPAERRRSQRAPRDEEQEEEARGARRRDEGDEGERPRVVEPDLADDPAVAPDGCHDGKGEEAQVAGAVLLGAGHDSMLAEAACCSTTSSATAPATATIPRRSRPACVYSSGVRLLVDPDVARAAAGLRRARAGGRA